MENLRGFGASFGNFSSPQNAFLIVLIVLGVVAMDSFSSDVSRFFTGSPTDKSVWMFLVGVLALIAGGAGATFHSRAAKS